MAIVDGGGEDSGDEDNGSSSSLSRTSALRAGCRSLGPMRNGGNSVIRSGEDTRGSWGCSDTAAMA